MVYVAVFCCIKKVLHFSDLEGDAKNFLAQGAAIAGYGSSIALNIMPRCGLPLNLTSRHDL